MQGRKPAINGGQVPVLSGVSLNVKGPCSKTKPSNELQPGPAAELRSAAGAWNY